MVKSNGNAYQIEMEGQKREVNVDSIIKDMKRPPLGERDGDTTEDVEEDMEIEPQRDEKTVQEELKGLEKLLKQQEGKEQKEGKGEEQKQQKQKEEKLDRKRIERKNEDDEEE